MKKSSIVNFIICSINYRLNVIVLWHLQIGKYFIDFIINVPSAAQVERHSEFPLND